MVRQCRLAPAGCSSSSLGSRYGCFTFYLEPPGPGVLEVAVSDGVNCSKPTAPASRNPVALVRVRGDQNPPFIGRPPR